MVEKEVILRRLVLLEEYLRDLEDVGKTATWEQFSADKVIRRYVERTLHMAIEACLDMTNHIISYEGLREPRTNRDSFDILREHGLLEADLSEKLKKMAQFRNVIVHDYIRLQPEIVYAVLTKHLIDISAFGKTIKQAYLQE